jgi:S1-C subfamily serine protease
MRLIVAIVLIWATAAHAAGPQDGPDGAILAQAAKSVVQVISAGCPGEEGELRSGSGFVLGKDGMIVTDLHVVAGCGSYQVKYPGIDELPATIAHVLMARDLALLKVDHPPSTVPALQLAKTAPQVKDELDVIGFPLGLAAYDSTGLHVTLATQTTPKLRFALRQQEIDELKSVGFPDLDTQVIRVDGNLLPGDSGAPLIDYQGNVAGIGDGGLERGTVGIGWATRPQYVEELLNSSEAPPGATSGIASVAFAAAIPNAGKDDRTVKCGPLDLVRSRDVRLGRLIKTTDDPVKLRTLMQDLVSAPIKQFDNDRFAIWTEPKSGAGIALPAGLRVEAGSEHCTVHTDAPNIDYVIFLEPLPFHADTAEWELGARRQVWLTSHHRVLAMADTRRVVEDRQNSAYASPWRFENGGMIDRQMLTGQTTNGKTVRVFRNTLSGRGASVSILVVNRDVKSNPAEMTEQEKLAWARGLLAVNLTALPPLQEAVATAEAPTASDIQAADMIWPGSRGYPHIRCGDASVVPLSQPRTLGDLASAASPPWPPPYLEEMLPALTRFQFEQITKDQFDVWVQPLRTLAKIT